MTRKAFRIWPTPSASTGSFNPSPSAGSRRATTRSSPGSAAKLAGLNEIPAVIIEADDRKVMELGLIENLQREDLNPIEEAEGYKVLMEDYNLTQEEAAELEARAQAEIAARGEGAL